MRVLVTALSISSLIMAACSHDRRSKQPIVGDLPSIAEYIASHAPVFDKGTGLWSYRQAEKTIEGKFFKEGRVLRIESVGSPDSQIYMWYTPCMVFDSVKESLKDFGFKTDAYPALNPHRGPTTRYYAAKESQSHIERVAIDLDPSGKTTCVARIYL